MRLKGTYGDGVDSYGPGESAPRGSDERRTAVIEDSSVVMMVESRDTGHVVQGSARKTRS